jgi:hypothetical protein
VIDAPEEETILPERIPADVEVQVVVARSATALDSAGLSRPVVAVFPDHDNWNDYGRNFFAKLHVRPLEGDPLQFHMRMMFEGAMRSENVFTKLFEQNGEVFSIRQIERPFVSLIPDVDDYRELIEALGFETGVSALRALRDAVVIRAEGEDEEGLRLIDGEEFHIGVLRHGGAYAALRRAGRHFRPNPPQAVEDSAVNFAFTARLRSADNPYTVGFAFAPDELFRDRTSILIGRNGAGKTQLLKAIVDGLHGGHPEGFAAPHFLPAFRPSRVLVFSSVPTDPFPRSVGAWHGIDYEYFAVNASHEDGADALLSALVTCKGAQDGNLFGPNRDMSRLDVVKEALDPIGLWSHLHLPLRALTAGDELPGVRNIEGPLLFPIGRPLNRRSRR